MKSSRSPIPRIFLSLTLCLAACFTAHADPVTRSEVLRIAEAYCSYRWDATPKNVLHGKDSDGVLVQTPDQGASPSADPALWSLNATNTGMPYKWGGFDSLESFESGIKRGKAAGDVYTSEKRRLGGGAVSSHAVGIDCSGFISRCWKLPAKQSTESLPTICISLSSAADLKPGDIMNASGGHVILFAKWLDDSKATALFYESSPYSKVISGSYSIPVLVVSGFKPMRYRQIRD